MPTEPVDAAPDSQVRAPARKFLIIFALPSLWSMGEGIGAGAFSRTPRALAAAGHDVHLLHPGAPGEPPDKRLIDGVWFHRFSTRSRFHLRYAPLPVRLAARLGTYLRYQRIGTKVAMDLAGEIRPDLVIGYGAFEAPVARRVAQRIGVPNVTRLFGNSLSLVLNDPIRFQMNFPEVIAFRTPCARLILTNDGADGQRVARRCGVKPRTFVHLRNGLDFEIFRPGPSDEEIRRRLAIPEDAPIVITVTRLAMEKKLERLLEAMPALLLRIPNAVAVLVGEGPERGRLEDQARALGISDAVRMPGAIPNRELAPWYRSASLMLSLLDRTNASNPVFEAMACERCVLALDAGTTREVVVHDETGVLICREDLPRLGGIVADLIEDPQRRERLGKAARLHARALLLDPPERMRQEIEILLDVIEESKRKSRS